MMESNVENEENKMHIKKVYKEKITNLLKLCIGIMIFSFITYVIGIFTYGQFDFGLIFEIISFIFIIIAYRKIKQNDYEAIKKSAIIAMIPLGWLVIYDFIGLLVNIDEVFFQVVRYYITWDKYFYYLLPYLVDVVLITLLILLYKVIMASKKIENKSVDFGEEFYDNL